MCDRIAIINKGNLVALDTTEKLLDRIKTKKINLKVKNIELNEKVTLFTASNGSLIKDAFKLESNSVLLGLLEQPPRSSKQKTKAVIVRL